jgi:hypothetical protein
MLTFFYIKNKADCHQIHEDICRGAILPGSRYREHLFPGLGKKQRLKRRHFNLQPRQLAVIFSIRGC